MEISPWHRAGDWGTGQGCEVFADEARSILLVRDVATYEYEGVATHILTVLIEDIGADDDVQ